MLACRQLRHQGLRRKARPELVGKLENFHHLVAGKGGCPDRQPPQEEGRQVLLLAQRRHFLAAGHPVRGRLVRGVEIGQAAHLLPAPDDPHGRGLAMLHRPEEPEDEEGSLEPLGANLAQQNVQQGGGNSCQICDVI